MSLAAVDPELEAGPHLMTVEEYLAFEEAAATKHEYVDGVVYAMAGEKQEHSLIAANVIGLLHAQLRGRPCRVHTSDMSIRIDFRGKTRFYYPDWPRGLPPGSSWPSLSNEACDHRRGVVRRHETNG